MIFGIKQELVCLMFCVCDTLTVRLTATHQHNEAVEIGEKLASVCFESFGIWRTNVTNNPSAGHVRFAHAHAAAGLRCRCSSQVYILENSIVSD